MASSSAHPRLVRTTSAEVVGDFADKDAAWLRFLSVANRVGLTVLSSNRFDFPGGGMTGVVVLAESHAAIHTWPELGKAWVELATCAGGIEDFEREVAGAWSVDGFDRVG